MGFLTYLLQACYSGCSKFLAVSIYLIEVAIFISIFVFLAGILTFFTSKHEPGAFTDFDDQQSLPVKVPVSVNYHFTRKCNYSCTFCFHTGKTSHIEPLERARTGLALLRDAGMRKLNFAGGEPFLHRKTLGALLRYSKAELGLESVSIVSNGSKIDEAFLREHAAFIDILAISCDSFDPAINAAIGRTEKGADASDNVPRLYRIASWCQDLGIKFKINSVVCSLNKNEDMTNHIRALAPFRWKVFQILLVAGENDAEMPDMRRRDARKLEVSDQEFEAFCGRHWELECLVPESNRLMKESYLILDEFLCFLDKECEETSDCILNVGVQEALNQVKWDEAAFLERGGLYDWSKEDGCGSGGDQGLKW